MRDSDEDVAAAAGLPLTACAKIVDQFKQFDRQALWFQGLHKNSARVASLTGALAVIMAILGLALKKDSGQGLSLISYSEIVFSIVAVAVAISGLAWAFKERWLLYRHQAELCRLLKFRFLLQPSRWLGMQGGAWIDRALTEISELKIKTSIREAIEAPLPRFSLAQADATLPAEILRPLVDYYRCKRLALQQSYLENRAGQNAAKIRFYVLLPPTLFFLSVIGAGIHFFLEYLSTVRHVGNLERGVLLAGLISACLPVAATWARTIRAAFEHSRNKSRFRAASAALLDLDRCLLADTAVALRSAVAGGAPARIISMHEWQVREVISASESEPRPQRVTVQRDLRVSDGELAGETPGADSVDASLPMQDMLWCEQILHAEHMEWLRLMVETEWYG